MFKRKKFDNAFLKISKEHQIVQRYTDLFGKLVQSGPRAGNFAALSDVVKTLKQDLSDHFQLEEQVLFPAALLALPSVDMADQILLLTREHGAFERDTATLIQIVTCHPQDNPDIPQETLDFLKTYTDNLKKHAQMEMSDLFPKMDADKRCREVIREFIG